MRRNFWIFVTASMFGAAVTGAAWGDEMDWGA